MANNIRVSGLKDIQKVLDRLPAKIEKRVHKNGLRAAARVIAKDAKDRVPVDQGDLKDSIVVKTQRKRIVVGFEKPTSRRAHLTEYGTKHAKAQPFMRPALDAKGPEAIKKAGEIMGRAVEREAAKEAGTYKTKRRK